MKFVKTIFYIFVYVIVFNINITIFAKNISDADLEVKDREVKALSKDAANAGKHNEDISKHYNVVWKFYKDEDPDGPESFLPFYIYFNKKYVLLFDVHTKSTYVYTIDNMKNNAISAKLTYEYKVDEKGKMINSTIKNGAKIFIKINNDTMRYNQDGSCAILIKTSEKLSEIFPESVVAKF